ncbi:hypothetical protein AB0K48_40580 [Nonomuraea sp. NPDC055795]
MVRRWLSVVFAVCATVFLVVPPASALVLPAPRAFVSNLDLDCFRTSPYTPPTTALTLRHLNPALNDLPIEQVTLGVREQLCVPVAKNGVIPPPEVLSLVRHIDLKCYGFTPNPLMNKTLNIRQLNPVLSTIPPANVTVNSARQLCVPVQKAGDNIPPAVLNIVRWLDLEKWDVTPNTAPGVTLNLRHLNPVLGHLPGEAAALYGRVQLALPVAKNGMIPPG